MSEKNYVVNVKTKLGTIVTVRGDSAQELNANISDYIDGGISAMINMFESDVISGGNAVSASAPSAVEQVQQAFGATIVTETPVTQTSFAPVPPPSSTPAGIETETDRWGNQWTYGRQDAPTCAHGTMGLKKGTARESGKTYFCWACPAGGPKWTGGRVDNKCANQFGVKL